VAEIVVFPVAEGGVLRVQAADQLDVNGRELVPATGIGDAVQRAKESLDATIASITPALGVVARQLQRLSPDELTVEFGLLLGAEHGVVVAKGKGEVHFTVTLAWKSTDGVVAPDAGGGIALATAAPPVANGAMLATATQVADAGATGSADADG
jgi:hypothetical protein